MDMNTQIIGFSWEFFNNSGSSGYDHNGDFFIHQVRFSDLSGTFKIPS